MGKKKNDVSARLESMFKLVQRSELEDIKFALNIEDGNPVAAQSLMMASGQKNGDYLVTVAARHNRVDVLKYLVDECGASLEVANHDGKRPIHEAAQSGHLDCLRFLISAGVDVNALKRATWTPLMLACTKDNLDVIKTLVEGGAVWDDLKNKDGWTSFHIACREGHAHILRYFLRLNDRCWDTRSNVLRTPLHTAALHGRTEAVRILISSMTGSSSIDVDLNPGDVCGAAPLTDAIKGGHAEVVRTLLLAQETKLADILRSKFDSLGRSPLDVAAMFGDLSIFLTILNATISGRCSEMENDDDDDGSAASGATSGRAKRQSTQASISSNNNNNNSINNVGDSLRVKDVLTRRNEDRGRTPLHYAALEGREEVVVWIVERLRAENDDDDDNDGVPDATEILMTDDDGKSALDIAVRGQHRACVDFLERLVSGK